jgi:putative aldouronate transport system substrate-binding protein
MKLRKILSVLMSAMVVASMVGCQGSDKEQTKVKQESSEGTNVSEVSGDDSSDLEFVELSYYVPAAQVPAGLEEAQKAINKYLKEKINASVKINVIDWGSYGQKMNVKVASGDPVDIMWTSQSSEFGYGTNAIKGAFYESEELFKQYAPKTWEIMDKYWDQVRVNGEIYGMPNQLGYAKENGYQVRKEYAEKYGLNTEYTQKTIAPADAMGVEGLEPYLEQVKKNNPDMIPLLCGAGGLIPGNSAEVSMGLWNINNFACTDMEDNNLKVLNFYETPEYKERLELARDWYLKGYINPDAATVTNWTPLLNRAGAVYGDVTIGTGVEKMPSYWQPWGGEIAYIPTSETFTAATAAQVSMLAIGKNSKNPERAAMFLELSHSDPEFVRLLCYGVEGVNYTTDGQYYTPIKGSEFGLEDWSNVNCQLKLLVEGQPADSIETERERNNNAKAPQFQGFVFNEEPVKTEIANCNSIIKEYAPSLQTGAVEIEATLHEFNQKLKAAGVDNIIVETQKQLDAWKTATGYSVK